MSILSPSAPLGGSPQSTKAYPAGSKSLLRFAGQTDQIALFFWVVVTATPMEGIATLIRYALVGYFIVGLFIFARQTGPGFVRGWPTLILPIMCFVSMTWAPAPSDAMRLGVFMFLTAIIPIYVATRLSGKTILTIYFLGEMYGAVLSLLHPNVINWAWTGVFGQKNFLAAHMFIMYATGLPLLLDPRTHKVLRVLACIFVPLCAMMIIFAKSSTTILLLVGSTGALVAHAFIWQPAARIPMARTFLVMVMIVLGLLVTTILFGFMQYDAERSLLGALGKDSTLTGRTFLWDIAHRVMENRPMTGVGAVGFWRQEYGLANEITRYFDFDSYVKFSFHNSFLENGVQFGYPGYYATYFIALWGCWCVFRTWMRNQSLYNAVFMVLSVMVLIRAHAEIDLAGELAPTAILLFIGGIRRDPPVKAQPAPVGPNTAAQPPPLPVRRGYPR